VSAAHAVFPGTRDQADTIAVEFATVGQTKDGKIYHRLWSAAEITALLKEHDLAKDENAEDK
jgi:hypothetical protein